jgi:meso-butanediol dehydrogenase/(S,S)-butanediol dehydrogenase/diacetyl reductase
VSAELTADLAGVVVAVTGAASGIGAAIAKRFTEAHAIVCGCDSSAESTGPEGVATWGKVDVSSDASNSSYVSKVAAEHGRIDVLVNAAGVGVQGNTFAPTHEVSTDGWQKVIDVNLTGAFLSSRAALPELIKAKGSVVHVASIMSYVNAPGTVDYGSAKAGLLGLTRVMALEYAKQGVRVNSVCPGFVDTPMCVDTSSRAATRRRNLRRSTPCIPSAELVVRLRSRTPCSGWPLHRPVSSPGSVSRSTADAAQ